MINHYIIPASIVFLIVLVAFLSDKTASKTDGQAWLFVLTAALLWPVTTPFILWKKVIVPLKGKSNPPMDKGQSSLKAALRNNILQNLL